MGPRNQELLLGDKLYMLELVAGLFYKSYFSIVIMQM